MFFTGNYVYFTLQFENPDMYRSFNVTYYIYMFFLKKLLNLFILSCFLTAFFVCNILIAASAFYDTNRDIVELNPSTFESRVIDSDEIWIVEFYAPW